MRYLHLQRHLNLLKNNRAQCEERRAGIPEQPKMAAQSDDPGAWVFRISKMTEMKSVGNLTEK